MAARIREVWSENLESEMALLRETIGKFPYVAMVGLSPPFNHLSVSQVTHNLAAPV